MDQKTPTPTNDRAAELKAARAAIAQRAARSRAYNRAAKLAAARSATATPATDEKPRP